MSAAAPPPPEPLARAWASARACGVTRLGDITRLDRLGVPVFHAVRPWSRALSVHQGKGLTTLEAQVGALMEAIESAHAEDCPAAAVMSPWRDLPRDERPVSVAAFAAGAGLAPGEDDVIGWVAAQRIADGGPTWVPFDAVSLDFTRPGDARISRSSTGQAAHFGREEAMLAALLEVIERDAATEWFRVPGDLRMLTLFDRRTIRYGWYDDLTERIRAAGLSLSLYGLPAITGDPAVLAELRDPQRPGLSIYGTGCDPVAEVALRKAMLEAVQSRLTEISGARDDILYRPGGGRSGWGLATPPPPHMMLADWDRFAAAAPAPVSRSASELAAALAASGYPEAAIVDLSPPRADVVVVKVFVTGLGAFERPRSPPRRVGRP